MEHALSRGLDSVWLDPGSQMPLRPGLSMSGSGLLGRVSVPRVELSWLQACVLQASKTWGEKSYFLYF